MGNIPNLESNEIIKFLESLKLDNTLKTISFSDLSIDVPDDVNTKIFLESSFPLTINKLGYLCYKDGEDISSCPRLRGGINLGKEWITDKIPEFPFQIFFDGNLRFQKESEAIYTCCVLAVIFQGSYLVELKRNIEAYNFSTFSPNSEFGRTFCIMLEKWQSETSSSAFNLVIFSLNKKLTEGKKDDYSMIIKDLPLCTRIGLGETIKEVKNVMNNNRFIRLDERPRLERLSLIDERNLQIEKIKLSSQFSELYDIVFSTSEDLEPDIQKTIRNRSTIEAGKLVSEIDDSDKAFAMKKYAKRLAREAIRQKLREFKKDCIDLYIIHGEEWFNHIP